MKIFTIVSLLVLTNSNASFFEKRFIAFDKDEKEISSPYVLSLNAENSQISLSATPTEVPIFVSYAYELSVDEPLTLFLSSIGTDGIDDFVVSGLKKDGASISYRVEPSFPDTVYSSNDIVNDPTPDNQDDTLKCIYKSKGISYQFKSLSELNFKPTQIESFYYISYFLTQEGTLMAVTLNKQVISYTEFSKQNTIVGPTLQIGKVKKIVKSSETASPSHYLVIINETNMAYFFKIIEAVNDFNGSHKEEFMFHYDLTKINADTNVKQVTVHENQIIFTYSDKIISAFPGSLPDNKSLNDPTNIAVKSTISDKEGVSSFAIKNTAEYNGFLYVVIANAGLYQINLMTFEFTSVFYAHPKLKFININKNYLTGKISLALLVENSPETQIKEFLIEFFLESNKLVFNKLFYSDTYTQVLDLASSRDFNFVVEANRDRLLIFRSGLYYNIPEQAYSIPFPYDVKTEMIGPIVLSDRVGLGVSLIFYNFEKIMLLENVSYSGEFLDCQFKEAGKYILDIQQTSESCDAKEGKQEAVCVTTSSILVNVTGSSDSTNWKLIVLLICLLIVVPCIVGVIVVIILKRKKNSNKEKTVVEDKEEKKEKKEDTDVRDNKEMDDLNVEVKNNYK